MSQLLNIRVILNIAQIIWNRWILYFYKFYIFLMLQKSQNIMRELRQFASYSSEKKTASFNIYLRTTVDSIDS